ncbi:MAG TPA: sigma-70 family RNA polymerase sigma factor [Acidobacteriaceae bacterium]|nr:sigma-70 family RNA polymerase sigma factor [Acidobacteriaceae bacterium]
MIPTVGILSTGPFDQSLSTLSSAIPPVQETENLRIAERLRAQDPHVVDELILQYQHRLMRYLTFHTGSRELAEDLFQETWMRVLTRGAQFRGDSQFVTWLFSIARNLVLDMRRKVPPSTSFEELTEMGDERWLNLFDRHSAFDHCASIEDARLLKRVFPSLSADQRKVILLRFQQEMPLDQIAAATHAPVSTVKARLYRGLALLKTRMTALALRTSS